MAEWQLISAEDGTQWYNRASFFDAGLDDFSQPPGQDPDSFSTFQNTLPSKDRTLRRRWGQDRFDTGTAISLITQAGRMYEYHNAANTVTRILAIGLDGATKKAKSLNAAGAPQNTGIWTIATTTDYPRAAVSRGSAFFASGVAGNRAKWDGDDTSGSGVTTWGLTEPATGVTASASGTGTLTISFWRDYTVAFKNATTSHISDIGPFTRVEAFSLKTQIDVSVIPTGAATENSLTTGTNRRVLLATSDGGPRTRLFEVTTLADNTTTTYTDTTTPAALLNNNVYVEVADDGTDNGILNNNRPPATAKFPTRHRGRLFLLDGQNLLFSKNAEEISTSSGFELGGRWEEAFPPAYSIPVGTADDPPIALLSDGIFLYIGTAKRIYRLVGDGPLSFEPPQVLFDNAGVFNQDVWQMVYRAGVPVGACWLTSDLRILQSDFNTYQDIGVPVTAGLRAATLTVAPFAAYSGYDQYNLYLLALNEGDGGSYPKRILAYDLDGGRWREWPTASTFHTALFYWTNPTSLAQQLITSSVDSPATATAWYVYNRATATDINPNGGAATAITVTLTPAWLSFGTPLTKKWLNRIEMDAKDTVVITSTLQGADRDVHFITPVTIGTPSLVARPNGNPRFQTAALKTGYRYFRQTIVAADTTTTSAVPLIRSWGWNFFPISTG